jgi:putative peptidoglycan lipid II flippase
MYLRIGAAGAVAALVAYCAAQDVHRLAGDGLPGSLLAAAAGGAVLVGLYVVFAKALRVAEVDLLTRHVRRRIAAIL